MSDLYIKHLERLPKLVKVGGFRFKLERAPYADSDLEGDYGCTNVETMRITIAAELEFQKAVNTLYHELNHAVNHAYDIDDSTCEEDMAARAATGWIQLRVDNPGLDRWLNRAIVLVRKMK